MLFNIAETTGELCLQMTVS